VGVLRLKMFRGRGWLGDWKVDTAFFKELETDGKEREVVARIKGRMELCGM